MTESVNNLYRVVAKGGYQYVAGMMTVLCLFEGPRNMARWARMMDLPIEVALYAARQVRRTR